MVFIHILRPSLLYTLHLTFRPASLHLQIDFISYVLHVLVLRFHFSFMHLFHLLFLLINIPPYRPYKYQHLTHLPPLTLF